MDFLTQIKPDARTAYRFAIPSKTILLLLIGFALVMVEVSHLVFLTSYPIVYIDEPWTANAAWTWLTTGVNFDSIHAGTRDQFGYEWLLMPALGNVPWVISFALLGLGLFQARLVSFVFGAILLIATILAGHRSYDTLTGLLAALFLSLSLPFLQSSHWVRWDIIMAAVAMFAYFLAYYALQEDKGRAHFLSGLLIGISVDIHPNGVLFIPALAAMYLVTYKGQVLRKRGTWLAAAGGLTGIITYIVIHILPSPDAYFAMTSLSTATQHQSPILALSLRELLASLDGEIGLYHFYEHNLEFALIGASAVFLAFRRNKADVLLLTFAATAFLSAVLFRGFKVDIYAILLYPFFMLMVAEMFVSLLRYSRGQKTQQVFVAALLVLFLFNSAIHYARPVYGSRDYDYYATTDEIRQVIPQDARVMGSPTWWLGLAEYDYSSALNLHYYRFFSDYEISDSLETIHPDIIVLDPIIETELFNEFTSIGKNAFPPLNRQEFEDFLAKRGELLLDNHGVKVFSIHWDDEDN